MTRAATAADRPAWREVYRRHGYFLNVAGAITIGGGIFIHLARVFFGDDLLLEHMFTPAFDRVLLVPMTYAAVAGILLWNRVDFVNRPQKLLYRAAIVYTTLSVPAHAFFSIVYGDVGPYVRFFPLWFSYVLFVPYSAFLVLFSTLRYRED